MSPNVRYCLGQRVTRQDAAFGYPWRYPGGNHGKAAHHQGAGEFEIAGRRREVSDGGVPGLYLVIQPSGKQSWGLRYRFNGRPRKWTIGLCPAIDLKTARELAREALRKVSGGADPCTEKKAAKAAARIPVRPGPYRNGHVEFVAQHAKRKLKPATAAEIERLLGREVVAPWRGRRLSQITRAEHP